MHFHLFRVVLVKKKQLQQMESQGEHEAYTYPPWYLACRAVNFYGLQVPSKSIANFTHISSCEYHITEEPYHLRPFLCYIWALLPSFQSVTTLMCDWWVAEMSMKDGWRSARGEGGGQCVMIDGMTLMQLWCADSLEYLLVVSTQLMYQSCCILVYS